MTSKLTLKTVLIGTAVLVGLVGEGYQLTHNQPTVIVNLPADYLKTSEAQSATVTSESLSPPEQTPASNPGVQSANATNAPKVPPAQSSAGPARIRDIQKAKYEWGYHYQFDMKVSSSPIEYVPWSGNGPPFINLYYRNVDGTAFQDTGMMHNGFVYNQGYVGYSLCTNPLMRFWSWMVVPPPSTDLTNRSLVYWSNPAPDDTNNLFQNGENCYTRASATSSWIVFACMEGDGELDKYWEETVNDRIVDHFDFMDICFAMIVDAPSLGMSQMTAVHDPAMEAMLEWSDSQTGN